MRKERNILFFLYSSLLLIFSLSFLKIHRSAHQSVEWVDKKTQKTHLIPKGTTVMIGIQSTHHRPELWPEPYTFDPSRFEHPADIQPYTFIPFIEGPRSCLGQFLAMLETKIILSLMIHTFDFSLANPESAWQQHRYMIPAIPAEGIEVAGSLKGTNFP